MDRPDLAGGRSSPCSGTLSQFLNPLRMTQPDRLVRNQVRSEPQSIGSRQDELARGLLTYPPGSDQRHVRERPSQNSDIVRSPEPASREKPTRRKPGRLVATVSSNSPTISRRRCSCRRRRSSDMANGRSLETTPSSPGSMPPPMSLLVTASALKWRLVALDRLKPARARAIPDAALRNNGHNGREAPKIALPLLFSRPFMEVIGRAIDEGRVSTRRAAGLLDLTVEDLADLFAAQGSSPRSNYEAAMARHRGPVLVDTNVILECFRVGSWRALSGGYPRRDGGGLRDRDPDRLSSGGGRSSRLMRAGLACVAEGGSRVGRPRDRGGGRERAGHRAGHRRAIAVGARPDAKRRLGPVRAGQGQSAFRRPARVIATARRTGAASRGCGLSAERSAEAGVHEQVAGEGPRRARSSRKERGGHDELGRYSRPSRGRVPPRSDRPRRRRMPILRPSG